MIRFLIPLLLLMTACAPRTGTLVSQHTGLTGHYTAQIPISDHAHHVLMGHLIDMTRTDGRTDAHVRALVIGARNDGVHRLVMREAWSNGVELPFQATHRRLDRCTHGHCRDRAVGMIFLSEALFDYAAAFGLTGQLIGTSDSIDFAVPATLFQELPEYRDPA